MLEALLKHFRSYGLTDLEFRIVNSKLAHAQEKLHELQKRVSFPVYQEREEEKVWSVLEGGKDDMFVYDRCGRLTYFIPFPHSILNESPLVSNAILITYFHNPCGLPCVQNDTFEKDDSNKQRENAAGNFTTVTEENQDSNSTEQFLLVNETSALESSNDLLYIINSHNEIDSTNSTEFNNLTDYDYEFRNNNEHSNETNSTTVNAATNYFDDIYKLFFKTKNNQTNDENINSSLAINRTEINDTDIQASNISNAQNNISNSHHNDHKHTPHEYQKPKKKSNRCVEADYEICKSWSKKRLLHAQKCCSLGSEVRTSIEEHILCNNFGKRRCKKIQSILKCCIKTVYTETTTTTELPAQTTEAIIDSVCCKSTDAGKFCRVSETGVCNEDEFKEDKEGKTNCQNLP